jgi:hypothetical protein
MNTTELTSRLVPLFDGRRGLRSGLHVEVREPEIQDPEPSIQNPVLDFISSDETLDRCDEVIVPTGWKLDSYQRNPVFQNAHQYGDVIFTLGRALITEVRPSLGVQSSSSARSYLFQRIQFAVDINPMARIAYGLYKGKFLNAVSVGFIPLRWENGTESAGFSRKYLEQELLEVSAVAIPANPNALALGLKSGAVEKADLTDLAELIHQTLDRSTPSPPREERAGERRPLRCDQVSTPGDPCPQLLALARELHAALRHS